MKIRGDRECQACGSRWSYYETGSVSCPDCGSLRSTGVADRELHTASPVTLDLTDVRNQVDEATLRDLASAAVDECRDYVRQYGFIDAGTLRPLADKYLAASELRYVARTLEGALRVDDDQEYYLVRLLRADEGERPEQSAVPESLRDARGLAYARAVDEYRQDLRTYLDEHPDELARSAVTTLGEHQKRIAALDGDVSLPTAEALVLAARAIGQYLIDDDENQLAQAQEHLDSLDPTP